MTRSAASGEVSPAEYDSALIRYLEANAAVEDTAREGPDPSADPTDEALADEDTYEARDRFPVTCRGVTVLMLLCYQANGPPGGGGDY